MTHDYHQGLEGYVEGAIYQDGCEECEFRAKSFLIGHMDMQTWARARERALKLGSSGLDKVSHSEAPVLQVIGDVLRMERQYAVSSAVKAQVLAPHAEEAVHPSEAYGPDRIRFESSAGMSSDVDDLLNGWDDATILAAAERVLERKGKQP